MENTTRGKHGKCNCILKATYSCEFGTVTRGSEGAACTGLHRIQYQDDMKPAVKSASTTKKNVTGKNIWEGSPCEPDNPQIISHTSDARVGSHLRKRLSHCTAFFRDTAWDEHCHKVEHDKVIVRWEGLHIKWMSPYGEVRGSKGC